MAVTDGRTRSASRPAVVAAGITAGTDVAYLIIIASEGFGFTARVVVVASFLALMALASLLGGRRSPSVGSALMLGTASGGLIGAGILGMFSIGLPLLIAGAFATIAWVRVLHSVPVRRDVLFASVPAAVLAPAALVLGVVAT
jgi:hypothetical protein